MPCSIMLTPLSRYREPIPSLVNLSWINGASLALQIQINPWPYSHPWHGLKTLFNKSTNKFVVDDSGMSPSSMRCKFRDWNCLNQLSAIISSGAYSLPRSEYETKLGRWFRSKWLETIFRSRNWEGRGKNYLEIIGRIGHNWFQISTLTFEMGRAGKWTSWSVVILHSNYLFSEVLVPFPILEARNSDYFDSLQRNERGGVHSWKLTTSIPRKEVISSKFLDERGGSGEVNSDTNNIVGK